MSMARSCQLVSDEVVGGQLGGFPLGNEELGMEAQLSEIITCCHISQLETDASIESLHSLVLDDLLGTVEGVGILHLHPCGSGLGWVG